MRLARLAFADLDLMTGEFGPIDEVVRSALCEVSLQVKMKSSPLA